MNRLLTFFVCLVMISMPLAGCIEGGSGEDGANGADGADGAQGPQGPPGLDGADGADGAQGPQGPPGNDGADGAQGPQGPQGPPGNDGANGADGAQGPAGPAGSDGADGTNGTHGSSALISTSVEQSGANCQNGGIRVDAGVDDNNDGNLDQSEVDSTQYICNGGSTTNTMLTNYSVPPTSMGCDVGGSQISHGLDNGDNGGTPANGHLEDGEIDSSTTICTTSEHLVNLAFEINTAGDSNPQYPVVYDGLLVFRADDGVNGVELWSYDGVNPPAMVADINPGGDGSYPSSLTEYQGELYFRADNYFNGGELWKWNITHPPTMVADIFGGAVSSDPSEMIVFQDELFFSALDQTFSRELMSYNSATNTVNQYSYISSSDASVNTLIIYDEMIFFEADDGNCVEVWRYNPSTQGHPDTQGVKRAWGSNCIGFDNPVVHDNLLFFTGANKLWATSGWFQNGIGFQPVIDQNDCGVDYETSAYVPTNLYTYNGNMYMTASDRVGDGIIHLWEFDYDATGWSCAKIGGYGVSEVSGLNGQLYLQAGSFNDYELYNIDNNGAVNLLFDINPTGSSSPGNFVEFNGQLYFTADDGVNGIEFWRIQPPGTYVTYS